MTVELVLTVSGLVFFLGTVLIPQNQRALTALTFLGMVCFGALVMLLVLP